MPFADPSPGPTSTATPKPFSISLSSKPKSGKHAPKARPATTSGALSSATRKRPHSALADPDSGPEDDSATNGRHEAVVGFGDDGKAISVADESNKKWPLVIKSKGNKDWRDEIRRKRGKNLLPAELQAQQQQQHGQGDSASTVERSEVGMEGGLKIVQPKKVDQDGDVLMNGTQMNGEGSNGGKKLTADEEAIAALLGDEKKKSTLTIPSAEDKASDMNGHNLDPDDYADEADRFRADVDSRPPPASLEDYAAVPVEEFGAAILRGLGWKDGEATDKRGQAAAAPREVKRRPALLGIGAKETPGGVAAEELGAWNQKKGRRKERVAYNPVMLRNKATGEMVTEEEMELRKLEAKKGKGNAVEEEDWRQRRMKNLRIDEGRKEERLAIENGDERNRNGGSTRKRDRDSNDERDRRRERKHISSRRERSRSMTRERSKYGSARRERSRSPEQDYRQGHSHTRDHRHQDRDGDSGSREKHRKYERGDAHEDYDRRHRESPHKRR